MKTSDQCDLRSYNLRYIDGETGHIVRFRRLDGARYESEDGEVFNYYQMNSRFEFKRQDRVR